MTSSRTAPAASEKSEATPSALPPFATRPVAVVAGLLAVLLTALSGRYGFHRDELYFLVAGDHPAWGYIDQPPLTPMLARLSTSIFGTTPVGLRVVAMLLAVATVLVVALIARELGGGTGAQLLAASCAATSGFVFATGHMLGTVTTDLLIWLLVSWLVLRLLRTADGRWYLAIGAAAGVGLLNKHLVAFLILGLLASVLAVGPRAVLRSWWLPVGVVIALLIAAPALWWQFKHGWPQLAVAQGIAEREGGENRAMFIPLQLVLTSPPFLPVWIAGLVRLCRTDGVRWARPFAVAYPLLAVVMLALGGKAYYVVPLLLVLIAAGAEPAVQWAKRGAVQRRLILAMVLSSAVVNAVAVLPVLPPSALGFINSVNKEQGEQVGWPAFVHTMADAWGRIPPEQRSHAVILTGNYGEAGAIERYGAQYGLPKAYSGHMSYADWGPPPDSADGPVLLVHFPGDPRLDHYVGCQIVGHIDNGVGLENDEQGNVVELCAGLDVPWSQAWKDIRHV